MLINKIPYEKDKSDCIGNLISYHRKTAQFYEHWYMQEYHMVKHPGLSTKQIFKKVFGQQLTCVNHTYRCWIWTFSNDSGDAVVYCLVDIRGVHWEMITDSNKREVIKLVAEIENRLIA
jgi:hypothetical protein